MPGIDSKLLDPRSTWRDPSRYDTNARELAQMFRANFDKKFAGMGEEVSAAGPRV
jgi:phosphoenolpyruvate carboxykinase (ATP)